MLDDRQYMDRIVNAINTAARTVKDAKFVAVSRRDFKRIRKITGAVAPAFTNDLNLDVEVIQDRSLQDGVISLRTTKEMGR